MVFTVDRSKWRSGGDGKNKIGIGATALLNPSGFMCCLGQTCNQLGVKKVDLVKLGEPSEIDSDKYKKFPDIFVDIEEDYSYDDEYPIELSFSNSKLSEDAMEINDDEDISQKEREKRLRNLFKEHGHKIKFIGESRKRAKK